MVKKPSVAKLDKLWLELVKQRAHYSCEYCHKPKGQVQIHTHHIFGRRAFNTRWDLDNGIALCSQHHSYSSAFSAHQTPTLFTEWLKKKLGKTWYERLERKHHIPYKGNRMDILGDLEIAKQELDNRGWHEKGGEK